MTVVLSFPLKTQYQMSIEKFKNINYEYVV